MKWVVRIAIGLSAVVVAVVLVTLVSSYIFNLTTSADSKPVRQLWHGQFVDADAVLTAYRQWGSGDGAPIVLIGGFAEPTFVWEKVGPLLAQRGHRVYALDLDGFGYTERHGPWTLDGWSDQVAGFISKLGIKHPIVVGHSLGAAVAVELVRRGDVDRVVLLDGDARNGGGALPGFVRDVLARTPLVTTALRLSRRWDWPVHRILADAYGPNHPPIDHLLIARWTDQFRADGSEHAISELLKHGIPGFSRSQLQNIRVKATVVWGTKDTVDSVAAGRKTADDLHAPFITIADAGHLTPLVAPAAVARAIERTG